VAVGLLPTTFGSSIMSGAILAPVHTMSIPPISVLQSRGVILPGEHPGQAGTLLEWGDALR
jgi:hypothetical protein